MKFNEDKKYIIRQDLEIKHRGEGCRRASHVIKAEIN